MSEATGDEEVAAALRAFYRRDAAMLDGLAAGDWAAAGDEAAALRAAWDASADAWHGRGGARRWVIGAMAAAALLVGWWVWPPPPRPALVAKGAGARLLVVAQRGHTSFVVRPDARLVSGDALGFFVTAPRAGYVVIQLVDADGATRLAPSGGRAGRFAAGARVPLPEGARMTAGAGCEWIGAAFSDRPLPVGALAVTAAGCAAPPRVPPAEGVRWQWLRVVREGEGSR